MSVDRCSGKFLLALVGGFVLSACSSSASTAVPPVFAAATATTAAVPTAAPPASAEPVAPLVTGLPDFTALVDRYGPAVVNVKVNQNQRNGQSRRQQQQQPDPDDPFGFLRPFPFGPNGPRGQQQPQQQQPRPGEGSGFVVSSDGYIITNTHVVKDATDITVKLTDRREFPAKMIGFDERTDVAVIKIEGKDLPTVRIGDPSKLRPGQWVVAIGSPFGMENSVTAGIVSATSRDLPNDGYVPFIQTDVAVNPGNSGGPLFNLQGEVVGINSQIYSESGGYMGLSFAIPIDIANDVREQLVSNGRVTRGMIGVVLERGLDADLADTLGLDRPHGAVVKTVTQGAPAEKAGILPGDVILSVNGKPVESDASLPAMISAIRPGGTAELDVWTDKKLRKVSVRVVEFQEQDTTAQNRGGERGGSNRLEPAALGLSLRLLSAEDRRQAGTQGSLVVEQVDEQAAARDIRPGDIILRVAGSPVRTVAEFVAAVERAQTRLVGLLIERDGRQQFVSIRKD